jgi:hypothetical protein
MADRKLLLIKTEATYGDDAEAAAANAVWAEEVAYRPMGEVVSGTPAKPGLGATRGFVYGEHGELTFAVPLGGAAEAGVAPKWGELLKACGYAETIVADTSVTYALAASPSSSPSVSVVWREGRRLHKLVGARGRVSFTFEEGQRPRMNVTIRGLLIPVADGAVLAPADANFTGWLDVGPVSQGRTTFSIGGVEPPLRSLTVEQSDNLVFSDRPNQKSVELVGARTFTGRLRVGSLLPSELSFEALRLANTLSTLALVHNNVAGQILTLNLKAENGMPTYSDDRGLDVTEVDLMPKPSGLAADDEVSLVLT